MVQVPGIPKAESDECHKIQALRARLKQNYGDTFLSGKSVFPQKGAWTIRLGQDTTEP